MFNYYIKLIFIYKIFSQNLPVFGTEIERKIRFVTSNDRDVVDTSLLNEIADETHKRDFYDEIMQLVWERLDQKSKDWKIVYKVCSYNINIFSFWYINWNLFNLYFWICFFENYDEHRHCS